MHPLEGFANKKFPEFLEPLEPEVKASAPKYLIPASDAVYSIIPELFTHAVSIKGIYLGACREEVFKSLMPNSTTMIHKNDMITTEDLYLLGTIAATVRVTPTFFGRFKWTKLMATVGLIAGDSKVGNMVRSYFTRYGETKIERWGQEDYLSIDPFQEDLLPVPIRMKIIDAESKYKKPQEETGPTFIPQVIEPEKANMYLQEIQRLGFHRSVESISPRLLGLVGMDGFEAEKIIKAVRPDDRFSPRINDRTFIELAQSLQLLSKPQQ